MSANEPAKRRFSSLLTVICRTAKKSANKVARIRRNKPVVEEPRKISLNNDNVPGQPTCNNAGYTEANAKEQGTRLA